LRLLLSGLDAVADLEERQAESVRLGFADEDKDSEETGYLGKELHDVEERLELFALWLKAGVGARVCWPMDREDGAKVVMSLTEALGC
jgi:hypothetical protein